MYSLDKVSIKSYSYNLEEYRADKELSGLYLMYKDRFKKDYPEYYKFIKQAQDKFYTSSVKDITMGVDYGFYHLMARHIIDHKCKHIVEYGPGFTTLLLHRIVQDLDYEVKVYSYEDNKDWFKSNKDNGLDPFNTLELVDMDLEIKGGLLYCTYIHDLEKHRDVDLIIIDGPGPLLVDGISRPPVTTNADLFEKTFDREITTLVEGRHFTQRYMFTPYKDRIRNTTIDDR